MNKKDFYYEVNHNNVSYRNIEGSILMLLSKSDSIYHLSKSAEFIWGLITKKKLMNAIVKNFAKKFSLPLGDARKDVMAFCKTMESKKALKKKYV